MLRDRLKVMVVDDSPTSRSQFSDALENIGIMHLRTANSAAAALIQIAAHPVHLVISDLNMPDMDGLQFLDILRQSSRTANVGFLLVAGNVTAEIIAEGRRLGMNNYMTKPFEPKDLLRAMEAIVGRL